MKLKTITLTLKSDRPLDKDATKLRGFFATHFNEYALLHQHVADKLIYRYPLIQYKMLEGAPLVLGIEEGAEVLKQIYDKFDEIKIGESKYSIMERGIALKQEEFGLPQRRSSATGLPPLARPFPGEPQRYISLDREERRALLRRIMVGNLLSASKGLNYTALEHIRLDIGSIQARACNLKGVDVMGFGCEFMANFSIPDYLGLGKSVSRGFGAVKRIGAAER
jgi:hypothetical protein